MLHKCFFINNQVSQTPCFFSETRSQTRALVATKQHVGGRRAHGTICASSFQCSPYTKAEHVTNSGAPTDYIDEEMTPMHMTMIGA
jgi:hypothetical protein